VGPYIADFCCLEKSLIVELDGGVHGQANQAQQDARREAYLKNSGYVVFRFPNGIVLRAPELFLQKVLDFAWTLPEARGRS
jgi:very-short-patch-repair endonuclease